MQAAAARTNTEHRTQVKSDILRSAVDGRARRHVPESPWVRVLAHIDCSRTTGRHGALERIHRRLPPSFPAVRADIEAMQRHRDIEDDKCGH